MKEYSFAYGNASVTIPLDETQVKAELFGNEVPALADIRAAVRNSLDHPIDSVPLRERIRPGQTFLDEAGPGRSLPCGIPSGRLRPLRG